MWKLLATSVVGLVLAGCDGSDTSLRAPAFAGYVSVGVQAGKVVKVPGYRDNFTVAVTATGMHVTDEVDEAAQTLPADTKTIQFVDQQISFDIDGLPGQVYRLYQAAFNRLPDAAGLGFWIKAAQDGTSVSAIAGELVSSPEFYQLYGHSSTAEQFVSALYENILHRAPERAGYDWWVSKVKGGVDRAEVLISFADSSENRTALAPTMARGMSIVPFDPNGPKLPLASSFENKMAAGAGPQPIPQLPHGQVIGPGVAYADFFQEGRYSMVAYSADFSTVDQQGHTTGQGKAYFFRKVDGKWVDRTSDLLVDQTGCVGARKLIVADFNGDGRPDVFAACHGYDGPPYPGENQRLLLSQADGKYRNVDTGILCFCHGASAAVLDRPGYADILVADQMVDRIPYFLINNRDGTFSKDKSRLPASLEYKQVWTAELIDFTRAGKYDAFLAGADPRGDGYQIAPTIFMNEGNNTFLGRTITIPLVPTSVGGAGTGVTLDVLFHNEALYLARTYDYDAMSIQKTLFPSLASTELYSHAGSYSPKSQYGNGWFAWIGVHQGRVYSDVAEVSIGE